MSERQTERLLSTAEVCRRLGVHRSTVFRYLADERRNFPKPRRLGTQQLRWLESEVEAWVARLPVAERRG